MRLNPALVLLLVLTAGCVGPSGLPYHPNDDEAPADEPTRRPSCEHPWPCTDEWPSDLDGPFPTGSVEHIRLPSHDGVALDGWLVRPQLPAGVRAPVILLSTPYLGYCGAFNLLPTCRGTPDETVAGADPVEPLLPFVENGYALALFSVRGTGDSGGCFGFGGEAEREDHHVLVEWLGALPWSNGRVGMVGHSYDGMTPWEAAVTGAPALKAIAPTGILVDPYLLETTPQGARSTTNTWYDPLYGLAVSVQPPVAGGAGHATGQRLAVAAERACPDVAQYMTGGATESVVEERAAEFWTNRRLTPLLPNVTAAVLVGHGFQDYPGHAYQDDDIWEKLTKAPKSMIVGQWGHRTPHENELEKRDLNTSWADIRLAWFDFWLKGDGRPQDLGIVNYQDTSGAWNTSTSWPPAHSEPRLLLLGDGVMGASAHTGSTSFVAAPNPASAGAAPAYDPYGTIALCDEAPTPGLAATSATFATNPMESAVHIAGNPFAHLLLKSDQPGGIIALHLVDLAPDFRCEQGRPQGWALVTRAVADLRFHEGNLKGKDFPVDEATPVRLDFWSTAHLLQPNHRLALVASHVDYGQTAPSLHTPQLTVLFGASELVLPIRAGALGLAPDTREYPAKPFT